MVYGPQGPQPVSIIVTNQVYADHYLDAALGLTLAVGLPGATDRGFYMIAVNRARTRSLSGLLRRVVRSTVQKRSRDALRQVLAGAKRSVESGSHKAGSDLPVK
jgi:hypothetical protein